MDFKARDLRGSLIVAAIILLAATGCGTSDRQVLEGNPKTEGAPSLGPPVVHSWMRSGSSSGPLIYAVHGCGGTCVLSYPSGELVGVLGQSGVGVCSDNDGNVFITLDSTVSEFAHGGTTPIATLSLPGGSAAGCSIDPETNNLAVIFKNSYADVAIFDNETGAPSIYTSHIDSLYCGYDNKGNLFVGGYAASANAGLAELLAGKTQFRQLGINPSVGQPGQVQWDGKYITYESREPTDVKISRLVISRSKAKIVSATILKQAARGAGGSSLFGDRLVVPFPIRTRNNNVIGIWKLDRSRDRFGTRKIFEFVRAHHAVWLVATQCRVLNVSVSGYYAWIKRPPSDHAEADIAIGARLR